MDDVITLFDFYVSSTTDFFVSDFYPGQEKNAKICKISGEKLVFSPQISYVILR